MSAINNLSQPQVSEIFRRIKALENAAPMNNGAVGRSGFEVYDNGTINVSSGNIIGAGVFSWQGSFSQSGTSIISGSTTISGPTGITGQLTIQGTTSVSGSFTVTGPTKLNGVTDVGGAFTVTGDTKLNGKTDVGGAFTVTGLTKLQGNTTVSGTLDATGAMSTKSTLSVEGVTTLKNDLNVTTGGKIKAGQMTIDPTANGGSIVFPNSQFIYASATRLVAASLQLTGTLEVTNSVTFKGLQSTTSAANVYINPSTGVLYYKS